MGKRTLKRDFKRLEGAGGEQEPVPGRLGESLSASPRASWLWPFAVTNSCSHHVVTVKGGETVVTGRGCVGPGVVEVADTVKEGSSPPA